MLKFSLFSIKWLMKGKKRKTIMHELINLRREAINRMKTLNEISEQLGIYIIQLFLYIIISIAGFLMKASPIKTDRKPKDKTAQKSLIFEIIINDNSLTQHGVSEALCFSELNFHNARFL